MQKKLLSAACLVTILTGCNVTQALNNTVSSFTNVFTSPEVPMSYMRPANQPGTEGMRNIAILDGNAASFIESELSGIVVNSAPYFTVVDRNLTDKIIKEQKFSESMFANASSRVRFGQISGADSLFTGHISNKFDTEKYSEKRTEDKKEYTVSCKKRTAVVSFNAKSTSVETGKVLFASGYSETVKSKACSGDGDSLATDQELAGKALGLISRSFQADVAPYLYNYKVELMEGDDSDMDESVEKFFDLGVTFAEKENFVSACKMFKKAQGLYTESVAITYNNAVCAESVGDIDTARAFYEQAMTLTEDADELKLVMDSDERLKLRVSNTERLALLSSNGRI